MKKPQITSELLLQLTTAAPTRVHKRLDKNPQVANEWTWTESGGVCSINTGKQKVTLAAVDGVLANADHVTCDCLLAPKCLHLLACVGLLEINKSIAGQAGDTDALESVDASAGGEESTQPAGNVSESETENSEIQSAANNLFDSASQLLAAGYQRASTVLIGQLLQAAHHARAVSLYWPAAAAIRVCEGIRKLRGDSRSADSQSLRRDFLELLSATHMIGQQTDNWQEHLGTARRKYNSYPGAMRLEGVFAEPVLTESGYAGMVVYLRSKSGEWFTVSDVREGEAERIQSVWKGGIQIGNQSVAAQNLPGCEMLIRGGGASADGRLGLGQKSEMAWEAGERWLSDSLQAWFRSDLSEQMEKIIENQRLPELARPAGWDLIGAAVEVVGAYGPYLVVRRLDEERNILLGIWSEKEPLEYRRNLQRLAAVPGMKLYVIARFDFSRPACLFPLAIAPHDSADYVALPIVGQSDELPEPKLKLPAESNGCWQLGWQRLQPEHFSRTVVPEPIELQVAVESLERHAPLDRRLMSILQGGHRAIPDSSSDYLQNDAAVYLESWQETAASILMELSTCSATLRTSETRSQTRENINRLAELWVAGELWCNTVKLHGTIESWVSFDK